MKKRLLIVVPSLKLGGQERVAVNSANIMLEEFDVTLVVFDSKDAVYSPKCDVVDLNVPAVNSKLGKLINVIKRVIKLRKLKRKLRIDYTISFGTSADIVNVLSGGCGKSILNIRGYICIGRSFIDKYLYRKSDGIICCSKEIAEELKKIVPQKASEIFTLYNPYDMQEIYNLAANDINDYSFNKTTLIMHGRLDEIKNFPRLIKAFSIVKFKMQDVQLLIVGEGEKRQELQNLINYYNLQDDVKMIGFRKNPFAYISRSSLYVLSSYSEGFPNALVEGMAFLPVVSVDCKSGPREILCEEYDGLSCKEIENVDYGILVPAATQRGLDYNINRDDEVLAEAILLMLSDNEKYNYYKEKAKTRASEFSFEAYKDNLMKVLKN